MLKEKRRALRYRFRSPIQYEAILEDGSFSVPITTPARDITPLGISCYSDSRMELKSKLRITLTILENEIISFIGAVTRIGLAEEAPFKFLIGVDIKDISDKDSALLNKYIEKIDIHTALKTINLEDIVDIHFVVGYPPIIKKIGKLQVMRTEPFGENVLRALLLNILDETRYKDFVENKEVNFVFSYAEKVRFRINLHIQQGKVEGVFRLIPHQVHLPSQLGLPAAVEDVVINNNKGLILVAGRTGSGKTTTLAGMVELLNLKRQAIIITAEKPIEYIHTNKKCIIKQREVGRDTLSFSNAARNALRQNPNVLVIGEILDRETMEVVITAAETGMLVLSSIHAPDSSQALDRIVSFFPPEMQRHMLIRLSLILKGLITQDLIPRKDGEGLIVGAEVLLANNALKRIIRDGDWKQIPTIVQTGRDIGMQSMRFSLEQYFNKGMIDLEYLSEYLK